MLARNEALEALVREHDDEPSWQVLEDWLLETNDPRAQLVRLEKAKERTVLAMLDLAPMLLGAEAAFIEAHEWRAGYARRASIIAAREHGRYFERELKTDEEIAASLKAIADAPALGLVRDVTVRTEVPSGRALEGLAALGRSVESLAIEYRYPGTIFDATCLAPFVHLDHLRVRAPLDHLTGLASVPSLYSLELEVLPRGVADCVRMNPLPELRSLTILTGTLLYPWHGVFDRLFEGTCAPKLEELHLDAAPTSGNLDFLRDLAQSKLGARLKRLSLAGTECSPATLLRLGRSIATVRDVTLSSA